MSQECREVGWVRGSADKAKLNQADGDFKDQEERE